MPCSRGVLPANDAVLSHLPAPQAAVYKPMLDVRPEYLLVG